MLPASRPFTPLHADRKSAFPHRLLKVGAMLGLYGLALVIYAPAFHGEFLWDDAAHVTRLGLQGWNGLWRIWFEIGATQQYYPVLHTWFWLQHAIWGDSSFAYHLLNTVLHATNACLLAALLRRIRALPQNGPSSLLPAGAEWLAALLLVVHPVCVESVAWISEQKNTLSTAFYLLAASCYLGYAARRTWKTYAAGTAFFLLALRIQNRHRHASRRVAGDCLVAAGAPSGQARCRAIAFLVCSGNRGRTHHGLVRASVDRRGRCSLRAFACSAHAAGRENPLVLSR